MNLVEVLSGVVEYWKGVHRYVISFSLGAYLSRLQLFQLERIIFYSPSNLSYTRGCSGFRYTIQSICPARKGTCSSRSPFLICLSASTCNTTCSVAVLPLLEDKIDHVKLISSWFCSIKLKVWFGMPMLIRKGGYYQ